MKKKKEKITFLSDTQKRIILLVVGSILTTLVLTFAIFTMNYAQESDYENSTKFLFFVFLSLAFTKLIYYFKERDKITLIRCLILLVINIALGIIVFFANNNLYLFSLVAGLYALSIVISRALILVKHHKVRDIIFNSIIITFAILVAVGFFQETKTNEDVNAVIVLECTLIALSAFVEVAFISLAQLRFKVLGKIIFRTYALEVLFGLATMIIAFSLVIQQYEPNITTFPDALWYCFAVVTTIGFGDFVAVTLIGRILTVVLGLYGIVVVAIITSIIVNFYNETNGKADSKELKDIKKDEKEENKK